MTDYPKLIEQARDEATGWRDMSEAPRIPADENGCGPEILVYGAGGLTAVAWAIFGNGWASDFGVIDAKGWRPLPPVPADGGA